MPKFFCRPGVSEFYADKIVLNENWEGAQIRIKKVKILNYKAWRLHSCNVGQSCFAATFHYSLTVFVGDSAFPPCFVSAQTTAGGN